MTTTTKTVFSELQRHAEQIRTDAPHDLSRMEVGDEWRQGDVGIVRLPDDFISKRSPRLISSAAAVQLAPGNTQGSRHCLDSLSGVEAWSLKDATPLDGPVLRLSEPRSIFHPEHGDLLSLPPGTYGVVYERAYAEELRRVMD